jgi:hypothetical protein
MLGRVHDPRRVGTSRRLWLTAVVAVLGLGGGALVLWQIAGGSSGSHPSLSRGKEWLPVTVDAAGQTRAVTLLVGQTLTVRVHSTYWQFHTPPNPAVLRSVGAPKVGPDTACPDSPGRGPGVVPGSGCGTLSAAFVAAGRGTSSVRASRTTCGEALRCVPTQTYHLTVTVH